MRKIQSAAIFFLAGVCLIIMTASSPAKATEYTLVMPVPKNLSMGSVAQIFKNMQKAIEKNTGLTVNVIEYKYGYTEDPYAVILDKMNKNDVDFVMVTPVDYLMYLMKKKSNAFPLFTFTMFGKPTYQACVYVRKSDNLTGMEQLRGKIWGGTRMRMTRYMMYLKTIDLPLNKFFKTLIFIPDDNITDLFTALLGKKIDTFSAPDYQVKMVINTDKKFKDIAPLFCSDYDHNWIILHRKGIPEEDLRKIKNVFLTADKNPEFAQFKFILTAVKGKFAPVDLNNLKVSKKIAELTLKNGWRNEEQAFYKANAK
jgi:ABC-type phosphate/phosphonate transport system substrate-binding protein